MSTWDPKKHERLDDLKKARAECAAEALRPCPCGAPTIRTCLVCHRRPMDHDDVGRWDTFVKERCAAARVEGAAAERARIVAWLLEDLEWLSWEDAARAIEAGEHEAKE